MKISFAAPRMPRSGTVVVAVMEDRKMSPHAIEIDKQSGGAIKRAMEASRFTGKADETSDDSGAAQSGRCIARRC